MSWRFRLACAPAVTLHPRAFPITRLNALAGTVLPDAATGPQSRPPAGWARSTGAWPGCGDRKALTHGSPLAPGHQLPQNNKIEFRGCKEQSVPIDVWTIDECA